MKKHFIKSLTALTIMAIVSTTDAVAANPLITGSNLPYGTLPFKSLTAKDYEEGVLEGIKLQQKEINDIANSAQPATFENTIVAFDRTGEVLNRSIAALSNLESALGSEDLMEVLTDVTPALSEHSNNIMLNEKLWERIKSVYDTRDQRSDLTPVDLRLLQKVYDSFILSGANLKGADRDRYRKLNAELSDLNIKFQQNGTNAMKEKERRLWLKESDLEGIPASIKAAYRSAAAEALAEEGRDDDGSLYLVTIYRPAYSPFMTYAKNRELRHKLYMLNGSKNTDGQYSNMQILKDIANIRLEIANLLGYKNFAEYQLQNTMAKTPETVMAFLENLRENYTEPMHRELKEIEEYAQQTEGADFKLEPWDYSYWSDQLKNARYAFNEEDLKPYFELNNTIDGVFGLATKLYGYKFKEAKNIETYHPDVRVDEVYDRNGKLLGLLYADFFYRPGKRAGAWMTEFRAEHKDDNGVKTLPLISIVCNFSKPVGNEPVLLNSDEVETFLHEFGHALHGLSAEAKYESLAGTNVDHDFVELFSQFNENFLTQQKYLDGFAKHYKTGKKMPKELLNKFVKAAQYAAAYATMRQLGFGYLDMAYHTIETPLRASADIEQFEADALKPVEIFPAVAGSVMSPSFGHIFSGGYAAGYYGYKWSELLDADAFAAFLENGLFDRATADKFLKMLQSGDTEDPMTLYIEFRGKQPTVDALLRRDGIIK